MTIQVLVCRPDGTQTLEQRTVPDDRFHPDAAQSGAQ
jgi:hypothetical protein